MVPVMMLWIPILLSSVVVFLVSSVIHTVLPYHRNDFGKLPAEDEAMEALRRVNVPPGEYVMPYAATTKAMSAPEYIEKRNRGPVALLTVLPSGQPEMGKNLALWFVNCVAVGLLAAYVASRTLAPATDFGMVFRIVGATAFAGYAVALWQNSIWYRRAWSTTLKSTFDGLVYAVLTAAIFGWFWPG